MQKLGKSGFQNATRCGLWWGEMLKARDQHKEAASVYFRICGEVLLFMPSDHIHFVQWLTFTHFAGTLARCSHVGASFLLFRVN